MIPLRRNAFRIFRVEYTLSASTRSGLLLGVPPQLLTIEMSAITGVKATESCRCPAVVTRAIGRHRESATRWIFVVTHPGYGPNPPDPGPLPTAPQIPWHSTDPPVLLTGVTSTSKTVGANTSAGMSFGGSCRAPAA